MTDPELVAEVVVVAGLGPCVCLAHGAQVPEPPITGVAGYPLAGLEASYIGLCSYTYNNGYHPTRACTSNPNGNPQT